MVQELLYRFSKTYILVHPLNLSESVELYYFLVIKSVFIVYTKQMLISKHLHQEASA